MSNTDNKYSQITKISSRHKWYDLKLNEVWKYRDLIVLFTKRNFVVTYKQTILGPAWLFINPLLTSVMHAIVFGGIAGLSTDGVPQLLFYLTSNAIWILFSNCVISNASTFTANAAVFGKVYFPRLTISLSNVLVSIIKFLIQMSMVLALLFYYVFCGSVYPHWLNLLLIPVILIQLGIMGLGIGIIISSMTTKYRDLSILVGFGMQLWMYGSPIVYPLSTIGEGRLRSLILMNPVTAPVEAFRYAVLGQGTILPQQMLYSWIFTIVVAIVGIIVFNRVERTFMDTV